LICRRSEEAVALRMRAIQASVKTRGGLVDPNRPNGFLDLTRRMKRNTGEKILGSKKTRDGGWELIS